LNRTLSREDSEEIRKGINTVLNERLNGYELGFGPGLSPNGSDERLLGQILVNGLVERLRTRWPDWPAAGPATGPRGRLLVRLGLAGWAARKVGKAGQAGPTGWISAQEPISNRKFFFFFSNLFYKLQINLNSNQIQEHIITPRKICNGMKATNNYLFKYITL
jgi:hypothetical protein